MVQTKQKGMLEQILDIVGPILIIVLFVLCIDTIYQHWKAAQIASFVNKCVESGIEETQCKSFTETR